MKKVFILILLVFFLSGCQTVIHEFKGIAETTVEFINKTVNDIKEDDNNGRNNLSEQEPVRTEIYDSEFSKYKILNDKEQRYKEFKDSDEVLFIKIQMLNYINLSREKYNVDKLELDILASRVANKMSLEAAHNNFMGHWNLNGEKPYHRYAIAGGNDHVSENAAASWSSANFIKNSSSALKLMKEAHNSFMAEKSPNDGHKKNVIEENHNFIGIGYNITGNQFRYYEEYIDRYLYIRTDNTLLKKGMNATFSFKTLSKNLYPYSVIIYYETPLRKMTTNEINKMGSYPDFSKNTALSIWPWELPEKNEDGLIIINFPVQKKGSYYVNIFLSDKPYVNNRNASTTGKIQASGIVFFVE